MSKDGEIFNPLFNHDEPEKMADELQRGWIKMVRSRYIEELIETSPPAFTLAAVIALRARYCPGAALNGLQPGECFLGDFKKYGMTMRSYRTAKQNLSKWGFATFRTTNKGTIARLIDTRLFDVLSLSADKQNDKRPTSSRQVTNNDKKCEEGKPLPSDESWKLGSDIERTKKELAAEIEKVAPDKDYIASLKANLQQLKKQFKAQFPSTQKPSSIRDAKGGRAPEQGTLPNASELPNCPPPKIIPPAEKNKLNEPDVPMFKGRPMRELWKEAIENGGGVLV